MNRQIDIDCKTKGNPRFCDDCFFANVCPFQAKKGAENKENAISVAEPKILEVWKESSKRKPLTP